MFNANSFAFLRNNIITGETESRLIAIGALVLPEIAEQVIKKHKLIGKSLIEELRSYYKEIVTEMLSEKDYENYDFTEIGKIAIVEPPDDIDNLPVIGFCAVHGIKECMVNNWKIG